MPMNKQPVTKAEDQIAESVADAQQCLDTVSDISRKEFVDATKKIDPDVMKTYLAVLKTYCLQFTVAVLLEELRRRDPARADELILWINQALEDGDTAGESVWQWHEQIQRGHVPTGVGPYKDKQSAPPADARTFTVKNSDGGNVEVLAVDSDTPGLVIAQEVRTGVDGANVVATGRWRVSHASSGTLATPTPRGIRASWPLDVARRIAAELGGLGVDWTLPKEDFSSGRIREATPDLGLKILEIVRTGEDCQYCTDADHAVTPWRATPSTEAGAA